MSVTIHRSVEDVFAVVSNVENDPKYSSQVVEAEVTTVGPLGVGSHGRVVSMFMGRRVENRGEVTAFEPNRLYAWRFTTGPVPLGGSFVFEAVDGGTRLLGTIEATPRGLLAIVGPLVARIGRRQLARDLANLKRLMEADEL